MERPYRGGRNTRGRMEMYGLLHVQTTQHCQQCAEDREDAIGMVLAYSCQFLMGK